MAFVGCGGFFCGIEIDVYYIVQHPKRGGYRIFQQLAVEARGCDVRHEIYRAEVAYRGFFAAGV